jgi:hypothetical protein
MPSQVVGLKGTVQQEILLTESKILFLSFLAGKAGKTL